MRGTRRCCPDARASARFIPAHAGNTCAADRGEYPTTVHPRACGEHVRRGPNLSKRRGSSPRMRGTHPFLKPLGFRQRFIPAHAGNTCATLLDGCATTVHPRACGEHFPDGRVNQHPDGSSPRMRGTPPAVGVDLLLVRFIPAHAGNTFARPTRLRPWSVHPRACGEHSATVPTIRLPAGSSPRMRGTRQQQPLPHHRHRFIPAHAGNTRRPDAGGAAPTVHPRACGEHTSKMAGPWNKHGSSPRMRGTPSRQAVPDGGCRFIPAHAGNTRARSTSAGSAAVHPRACGEHSVLHSSVPWSFGSSPRMRGTRVFGLRDGRRPRFIPAHAGNTAAGACPRAARPVHPRACGEHAIAAVPVRDYDGSSPRMRGTPFHPAPQSACVRFIPAHAGNTRARRPAGPPRAVHPRACGEHSLVSPSDGAIDGSSPRMRGTRARRNRCARVGRFIPAHAGNTRAERATCAGQPVHPRACGEHISNAERTLQNNGSSPRMRGTRGPRPARRMVRRFIPAHAGNTWRPARAISQLSVHPRACGEHCAILADDVEAAGSSPRMRGTHQSPKSSQCRSRFIPAHAGNTCFWTTRWSTPPVHPRACGEHRLNRVVAHLRHGSSPRMRGTPTCPRALVQNSRFIPAHAGNTHTQSQINCHAPVHPRACGEHQARTLALLNDRGSSPRMRGTLWL